MTPKEWLDKCDYEGGDILGGLQYGLTAENLDDSVPEFNKIIDQMHKLYVQLEDLSDEALEIAGYEFE